MSVSAKSPATTHMTTVSVWIKRPLRRIQIAEPITKVPIAIALITRSPGRTTSSSECGSACVRDSARRSARAMVDQTMRRMISSF